MNITTPFKVEDDIYELEMIFVEGTKGPGFMFGVEGDKHEITVKDFFIAKFPVTRALWKHIMGKESSDESQKGYNWPADHLSWFDVTNDNGFLYRINQNDLLKKLQEQLGESPAARFRLPSEAEWEYAARGGKYWKDNFMFSGSNNIDEVAWFKDNSGNRTHEVGEKSPNQLGIYEMNGNIWEWCEDIHTPDTTKIPKDGSPYPGDGTERILRGGCHHNWAIHCTVSKRYAITPDAFDGCIGFRLVMEVN